MDSSDKSLIESHLKGERAAFAELVRRHGDGLLGYLCRTTGNRQVAEDLFQETFRRVHEKAATFRGNNFRSWLYRIATNVTINEWRRRKRRPELSLDQITDCQDGGCSPLDAIVATDETTEPGYAAQREELKSQVRSAVATLPAKQRLTLVMAYYQQMSYAEIAAALGCSTGAVKTHMFRALKRLGRLLPDAPGGAP
jgi:RNA polymerase sigma-70 factor (ECF subfamily)